MRIFFPPGSSLSTKSIAVEALDSLAELRGEVHAGSLSSSWRRVECGREATRQDAAEGKVKFNGHKAGGRFLWLKLLSLDRDGMIDS